MEDKSIKIRTNLSSPTMNPSFLEIARQGRNSWQQYLLGTFLVIMMPIICVFFVSIPLYLILLFSGILSHSKIPKEEMQNFIYIKFYGFPFILFIFLGLWTSFFLLTLVFVIEKIHQRKFSTLLGFEEGSIDWRRMAQGFCIYFGLRVCLLAGLYLLNSSRYKLSFNTTEWFLSLPFSFLMSFFLGIIVCLLFFGYWLQGLGILVRKPLRLTIIYGVLLVVLVGVIGGHQKNPTPIDWLAPLVFNMFYVWLVLKDGGLELLLGFSTANYFFAFTILEVSNTKATVPSIFTQTSPLIKAINLGIFIVLCALFYYICFYLKPRKVVR